MYNTERLTDSEKSAAEQKYCDEVTNKSRRANIQTYKSATRRMYTCLKMPPPTTIYSYAFHELRNNFPYLLMFMLFNHVIKIMSFIFLIRIDSQVTIAR